jgi:hypothetical protein
MGRAGWERLDQNKLQEDASRGAETGRDKSKVIQVNPSQSDQIKAMNIVLF